MDKLTYPQFLRRAADNMEAAIIDGLIISMDDWLWAEGDNGYEYDIHSSVDLDTAKGDNIQCFACLAGCDRYARIKDGGDEAVIDYNAESSLNYFRSGLYHPSFMEFQKSPECARPNQRYGVSSLPETNFQGKLTDEQGNELLAHLRKTADILETQHED